MKMEQTSRPKREPEAERPDAMGISRTRGTFRDPFKLQRLLRRVLLIFIVLGVLYLFLRYDYPKLQKNNDALYPAIGPGERVLLDQWNYVFNEIKRNDQVGYRAKWGGQEEVTLFSRVLGIPGDRLGSKEKRLIINGRLTRYKEMGFPQELIPGKKYLLLNDKEDSPVPDSRFFGLIERNQIIGKLICQLPF